MKVEQIYQLVNEITKEYVGAENVIKEDLSNVVEMGETIENAMGLDNYVKQLVDHIGRMIFVNRSYSLPTPGVLMDGWEYGSILEKVSTALPDATENESWDLQNGTSYDPNIFTKPDVISKFYNNKVTFEIPMSFTERQVKSSFSNATQLNAFMSMIRQSIENSMTIKLDSLVMRTINNIIGETMFNLDATNAFTGKTGIRAVNLLYLYNQTTSQALTPAEFIVTPDAIRFAVNVFKNYIDRLKKMSNLFNIGGQPRFTPADRLHVIMLSEFKNSADVFLQSGTFNDQYTALPGSETVTYWQGSGSGYDFNSTSSINIKTGGGHDVEASGILGIMFDRDALGVCNMDQRVTSNYNPKAEFYNNWYKMDAQYFNDTNENCVVFYVA